MGTSQRISRLGYGYKKRPMAFSLIVDDFTAKYVGIDNVYHLRKTLLQDYEITIYWGVTFIQA
jgi:hypothetical protein